MCIRDSFPAILMGIFSRRMNKQGAIAGIVLGLGFTTAYIVYFKFLHRELNAPEHWWMGISPEGIGTVGMVLNFLTAAIVARVTPAPSDSVQALVTSIRVPSSPVKKSGFSSAAHR